MQNFPVAIVSLPSYMVEIDLWLIDFTTKNLQPKQLTGFVLQKGLTVKERRSSYANWLGRTSLIAIAITEIHWA